MGKFEELKAVKQRKIQVEQPQQQDQQVVMGPQFQLKQEDREAFDEAEISKHVWGQRQFYNEYKSNWGQEYEGKTVNRSEYVDPAELQVQHRNLSYQQKKQRKAKARLQKDQWTQRLESIDENKFGLSFSGKGDTYSHDMMLGTVRYALLYKQKDSIITDIYENLSEEEKDRCSQVLQQYLEIQAQDKQSLEEIK